MNLSRSVYRMLEDIVGSDNISEEPAVLDSYAYNWPVPAKLPTETIPSGRAYIFCLQVKRGS